MGLDSKVIIVCDDGTEEEAITRFARIGLHFVNGYVEGGVSAWKNSGRTVNKIKSITSADFKVLYEQNKNIKVVDVRNPPERVSSGYL